MSVMQPEGLYVTTPGRQIPEDKVGVDIGRRTIESFSSAIGSARTIFRYERINVDCIRRHVGDLSSVVFTIGMRIERGLPWTT